MQSSEDGNANGGSGRRGPGLQRSPAARGGDRPFWGAPACAGQAGDGNGVEEPDLAAGQRALGLDNGGDGGATNGNIADKGVSGGRRRRSEESASPRGVDEVCPSTPEVERGWDSPSASSSGGEGSAWAGGCVKRMRAAGCAAINSTRLVSIMRWSEKMLVSSCCIFVPE